MMYCPEDEVIRAQVAVFLLKVSEGVQYSPQPSEPAFQDILGHWAEYWITKLKQEGITGGCKEGYFCPDRPTTRAEIAVFLLRLKNGSAYTPDPATGSVFADVPSDYWAATWIEQLAEDGLTSGCGSGNYCPEKYVTRAELAVFLDQTIKQMAESD
jgi:hypothetical protein